MHRRYMGKWASKQKRSVSKKAKAYSTSEANEDVSTSTVLRSKRDLPAHVKFQHSDAVTCLDSNKNFCVSGSTDGTIIFQDLNSETLVSRVTGHEREVTKVAIHKSAEFYASASRDKSIKVWKGQKEKCMLTGHELSVTAICCDMDFSQVWSGSRDNTVRLWDIESSTCIATAQLSRNLVTDLGYSSEMNVLAQASEDRILKLWDPRSIECIYTFPMQSQIQTSCAISNNRCVTTNNGFSGQGCEICVWDLRQRRLLQTLKEHTQTVSSCKFISTSLVSCSHDSSIKLWNQNSDLWSLRSNLHPSAGTLTCLSVVKENTILCAGFDKGLFVVHINKGTLVY